MTRLFLTPRGIVLEKAGAFHVPARPVSIDDIFQSADPVALIGELCARTEAEPSVATTTAANFLAQPVLATEAFGPFTLIVVANTEDELAACAAALDGQLTATLHATPADLARVRPLLATLEQRAGRLVMNAFPTGVEVSPAMQHGGPYPATTDARFTSVGTAAIFLFTRPVCYQGWPDELLPPALQDANPLRLLRLVDGKPTRDAVSASRQTG